MSEGPLILAYHGCDITVRDRLVKGTLARLKPSTNCYDWLGDGVYFFEGDAERAFGFAQASHRAVEKLLSARPIVTPSVVGAVVAVSRCWDMTTVSGQRVYRSALAELRVSRTCAAGPCPSIARPILRTRLCGCEDWTVLCSTSAIRCVKGTASLPFKWCVQPSTKGALSSMEGVPIRHAPSTGLAGSAVRAWLVPAQRVGSALLSDRELVEAEAAMTRALRARTANKPRMRALP